MQEWIGLLVLLAEGEATLLMALKYSSGCCDADAKAGEELTKLEMASSSFQWSTNRAVIPSLIFGRKSDIVSKAMCRRIRCMHS